MRAVRVGSEFCEADAVALNPQRDVVVNTASLPSPDKTAEAA
jgi:hypothetical protein